jgi:NAD(P)-dependent dehydrogenase (short-subunit alcohol dehydrogenase family)
MNTKKLSDKVALVTGGTSGIGKTTATEFARAGAKVVLSGRREKEGANVVAEIQQLGGAAAFIRADVAKDADVKAMVDFTIATYGRLDIAFNNAGVEWIGPLDQATEAEYRRICRHSLAYRFFRVQASCPPNSPARACFHTAYFRRNSACDPWR